MVDAGVAQNPAMQNPVMNPATHPGNPALNPAATGVPALNPAAGIQPHTTFLNPGGAAQQLTMSPQAIAQGITYESCVAGGMDNAAMIAQGYALPTP
jgi:hypothetical protein